MTKLSLTLTGSAEAALKKKIAEHVGKHARKIVTALHTRIVEATPFNTGRTIGSWHASAGTPILYDIASLYGEDYFAYSTDLKPTNKLPVGAEDGRKRFEQMSLRTVQQINFEQKPYQKFFITNGAALDSITDSGLPQGPGSRALMVEYGAIPHYDLYRSTPDNPVFSFEPRGTLAVQLAVISIQRDVRARRL